jgi:hypothetical protein
MVLVMFTASDPTCREVKRRITTSRISRRALLFHSGCAVDLAGWTRPIFARASVEILEGGEAAFRDRARRLHIKF